MTVQEIIRQSLTDINIMQLATCANEQPWLCTVHFYMDDAFNFYWFSTEQRRHSKELRANPNASVYALIHENKPDENYVIDLSSEGSVEYLGAEINQEIGLAYAQKLGRDPTFLDDVRSGKNLHMMYMFTPKKFVLFDNKHFPEEPRQEWSL